MECTILQLQTKKNQGINAIKVSNALTWLLDWIIWKKEIKNSQSGTSKFNSAWEVCNQTVFRKILKGMIKKENKTQNYDHTY